MAVCPTCDREMTEEISCLTDPILIGGELYEPIRWGDKRASKGWRVDLPCGDCGTPPGGVHHPGCCVERCPVCLGQAFGCRCFNTPDDYDQEDDDRQGNRHQVATRARCSAHLSPRHYRG
jgi:hypothetical protein